MGNIYYSDEYKYEVFVIWYNNGKPSAPKLAQMIPDTWEGRKPNQSALQVWIRNNFLEMAEKINSEIESEIEGRLVKEKVEMLSRHADLGNKMQNIGIDYIEQNKDQLTSSAAVRLLVEGVRIERDSRGLPQAIEKMLNETDEELLSEVMELIEGSPVEILDAD